MIDRTNDLHNTPGEPAAKTGVGAVLGGAAGGVAGGAAAGALAGGMTGPVGAALGFMFCQWVCRKGILAWIQ